MKNQQEHEMPRRAYPYGRESKGHQAEGDGPQRQQDWSEFVCQREGWYLDDSYHFFDMGRSGFYGEHLGPKGELTRFLNMVRSKEIPAGSVLILENLDRLSRQEVDLAYDVFRELIKAGIWICTKVPERVYKRESVSLMDLMEPLWLFYLAHQESLKKSDRIRHYRESQRAASRKGVKRDGKLPPWVGRDEKTGDYFVREDRKRSILKAVELVTTGGLGVGRAVRWLQAHKDEYPPWGHGKWKGQPVEPRWRDHTLADILKNRTLVGEYSPTSGRKDDKKPVGPPIPGYYPALLTEDQWSVLQAAMRLRQKSETRGAQGRPGERETNLYTGLVFEARTRSPMCVQTVTEKGKASRRLRKLVPTCLRKCASLGYHLPYAQVERGLRKAIGQLKPRDVLPPSSCRDEREERITTLTGRLIALEQRRQEIEAQLEDPDNGEVVASLAKALVRVKDEVKGVTAEREKLRLESRTSRGEQLAVVQTIDALLAEAELEGEEKVAELRRRLKAAIGWLVDSVWVVVQTVRRGVYVGHAQIYLRGGGRRYVRLLPADPPEGMKLWSLADCDFRAGEVGDAAAEAPLTA